MNEQNLNALREHRYQHLSLCEGGPGPAEIVREIDRLGAENAELRRRIKAMVETYDRGGSDWWAALDSLAAAIGEDIKHISPPPDDRELADLALIAKSAGAVSMTDEQLLGELWALNNGWPSTPVRAARADAIRAELHERNSIRRDAAFINGLPEGAIQAGDDGKVSLTTEQPTGRKRTDYE